MWLERIRNAGVSAWLKLLSGGNKLVLVVCAGLVAFDQANHAMFVSAIVKLTPTQQLLATMAFSAIVQWAIRQAKKAA
jgi:hypothetical protein